MTKISPCPIKNANELITSREQTRAGFIAFALEKNRRSSPIVENAKSLKVFASRVKNARDLLSMTEIRPAMLTAAGLSDKSLAYFNEEDKSNAIKKLIKEFLEPAGHHFADELVYRYLLFKGDSLGGTMRNIVGIIAQQRLLKTLISNLNIMGIKYLWLDNISREWRTPTDLLVENNIKAITWKYGTKYKTFAFNLKIPIVNNNVDLCLFNSDYKNFDNGKIVNTPDKIIMLGELKGGIDPAGADEHWKTGNSALSRIRQSFNAKGLNIDTSFIAAAIENKMANEIFKQLQKGTLTYAANLTIKEHVVNYCDWIIKHR